MSVIPELKQQLSELSDEEFQALKAKLGGNIGLGAAGAIIGGAEAAGAESRRLLPTQLSILQGRNIPVTPEATRGVGSDLETFTAKERIKSGISEERTRRLLGTDAEGFRAEGFTSGGVQFKREVTEEERRAKREEDLEILKAKEKATAEAKEGIKAKAGERQARISLSVIGGSAQRLAQRYVDGVKEGGMGDVVRSLLSSGAQKLGGSAGDKFKNSGAFPGQKVELITKLMPILTQQGDKAGSVRLVSTVFDRLLGTLPSKATGPETAKEQIEATLTNMFTFANSIKSLGITNEQVNSLSDEELSRLGDRIESFADSVRLSAEEEQDLESLLNVALEPLDNLIGQQMSTTGIQAPQAGQVNVSQPTPEEAQAELRRRGL